MKRIKISILTLMFMLTAAAVFAQDSNINFKAGIQYPEAPDKVGFDSAVTLNLGLDKYFTLGVESGFGWVQWKETGSDTVLGQLGVTSVEKSNLYTLPLLAVATIRLADMMETNGIMPYVSGGAGYSWTWYRHPEAKELFHGFTWQVTGGVAFKLGSDSNLMFLLEGGYRSAAVENADNYELDMSGVIARAGVSFPLESSDY